MAMWERRKTTTTTTTTTFAALLYLANFTLAQNLSFVRPRFEAFDTSDDGVPWLIRGDDVTVRWESDFQYTSLFVYQQVETDLFRAATLARGYRQDRREVTWRVNPVPGGDSLNGTFHFELRNGVDADCEGCSLNSRNFEVVRRDAISSTTTASTTTTTSTAVESTASSTANPISTTASLAGAQSTQSISEQRSDGSGDQLRIGLGVGLGLGLPILLAIVGILFCMRRRRRRRNSLPRGRQPSPASGSDRAVGAWQYQDGRQSQQSMLHRPSTTARSETSSWSHRSWIEPFDFEQAEMREQDAVSQLRQSIYSSSKSTRSHVSSRIPLFEWGMLDGIPEQPQAVHDGRWSRTL